MKVHRNVEDSFSAVLSTGLAHLYNTIEKVNDLFKKMRSHTLINT